MARKPIPVETQNNVLTRSRRRCCICFGLNRDTDLKAGQIAHLDGSNSNNVEDNLAYLCLVHHDEFDSRTSQRKGFTIGEVKIFRSELYAAVGKAFSVAVHFGNVALPKEDPYAGQYIRLGAEDDSAEITLTPIPDGMEGSPTYAVTGFALWGTSREFGPNMGELSFIGTLIDGAIEDVATEFGDSAAHKIRLAFDGDRLTVDEGNWIGAYGFNVNFIGEYRKVTDQRSGQNT